MENKLTLRIDKHTIEQAKSYAKNQKTSLSQLVETYLISLTQAKEEDKKNAITPLVRSLMGIAELPESTNAKKDYYDFLENKYK